MHKWLALLLLLLYGCTGPAPQQPAPDPPPMPAPPAPGTIRATVQATVPAPPEQLWIQDIAFATANHGWILFGNGPAVETRDGGASWQPTAFPEPFEELDFYTSTRRVDLIARPAFSG
ncbi:MAG TPA: hypothetical protein VNT75_09265 [Symbiobacteriaceae bacterium]|nr:hypothetical protein [Symbiobacteriaceae bacterium]